MAADALGKLIGAGVLSNTVCHPPFLNLLGWWQWIGWMTWAYWSKLDALE